MYIAAKALAEAVPKVSSTSITCDDCSRSRALGLSEQRSGRAMAQNTILQGMLWVRIRLAAFKYSRIYVDFC